jgi:hypothetical protein
LIHPNPTFGKCYVQIPEDCTPCVLQIFDIYGKVVLKQPIISEDSDKLFELDLDPGLPNLLFWKLNNKDQVVSAGKLLFVK